MDATLAGSPACANKGFTTDSAILATSFGYPPGKGWFRVIARWHIENQMPTWGHHSRAIVHAKRGGDLGGHFFNVVNKNGHIHFVDGQTGRGAVFSKVYHEYWMMRTDKVLVFS